MVSDALRPYDRDVELPMETKFWTYRYSACDVQNGRLSPNSNGLAKAARTLSFLRSLSSAADVSELGTSATLFRTQLATEEELIEAIRHGECWPVLSAEAPRVSSGQRNRRGRNGRRGDRDNNGRRGRRDGRQ